jgi:hypothetical protein
VRPVPIPDGVAEAMGGRRVVIGEPGDPTRTDVRPCEYVFTESTLYPGRPAVSALIVLDDADREAIAAGAGLWLTLDGGELPWSLRVAGLVPE